MRAEIKHLQRSLGVTMIYVTHDQIEAMTLADRVVLLNDGVIQQVGTPDEIYDNPGNLFVAGFIGSPPMNFVEGLGAGGRFAGPGVTDLPCPGTGKLTLGFRAEDTAIADTGRFSGTVYEVEPTGEATYVVLQMGPHRVNLRCDKKFRPDLGTTLRFDLGAGQALFFDTATGQRVR